MVQFYFLSILFNVVAGLILIYGKNLITGEDGSLDSKNTSTYEVIDDDTLTEDSEEKKDVKSELKGFAGKFNLSGFDNATFRLITGILCVFIGLMKLLSCFKGDIPVIGDLFPAVAGFFSGTCLLIEYFITQTSSEVTLPNWVNKLFVEFRKYIGIACLVIAVLHFIFPQAILL